MGFTVAFAEALRSRAPRLSDAPVWALALGALLPDVVDKPPAFLIYHADSGRLWAHTVAFALVLGLAAAAVRSPRVSRVLGALALGSLLHLVLDRMWENPAVALWPLLGWRMPIDRGVAEHLHVVHPLAIALAGEAAGALLLAWALARRRARRTRNVSSAPG